MRIPAQFKTLTLTAILITSLALGALAQTKNDAAIAFNAAAQLASTDLPGAVKGMNDVVVLCGKIGADANDIKANAQKTIPGLHYQIANNFLKDKKIDDAQLSLEKSLELATLYNDADTKDKASKQLSKVYVAKGNGLLKAEKTVEALALFDKAIVLQPTYAKAYFASGQAYKKKADFEKMKTAMDQAITYGKETGDTTSVNNAKNVMRENLVTRASKAVQKGANDQAISLANAALTYNSLQSKDAYYLLAVAYNKTSKWDNAIEAASKGLAMEENSKEKKAHFYLELGNAQKGKGDTSAACASYKNASFGVNAAVAAAQVIKLGCK
jgi:tetratricopeptide (TPR) repeat protein